MKYCLTWLFILGSFAFAQRDLGHRPTDSGGPLLPEQAGYDVTFYDLAIDIFPESQSIDGRLTVQANILHPLEWFVLHLDSFLTVSRVMLVKDGKETKLNFSHQDGQIWTHLKSTRQPGEKVEVRVYYGGKPRVAPAAPWVGGFTWTETPSGAPWITTCNQNDGADLWWPCKDHPSDEPDSMALHITVPKPLIAAANGRLRQVTEKENTRTYHWFVSTPINNYGVALNIAPYRTIEGEYQSIAGEVMPVTYWVLPENYDKGKVLFKQIMEHLAFFENLCGPYPFRADKYGVAETPYLGMEHQTIIAYGANYSNAPFGYDILHHHELGHEWWGNMMTALDWRDFWLHEGFCSYMHPLYVEHLHGREAYMQAMAGPRPRIRNERPLAPRTSETTTQKYFRPPDYTETEGDVFNKGVWVLHTLRYLIGDADFFLSLRRMCYPDPAMEKLTDGSQCRFATTDDYLEITEKITGKELDWFFEVYMRRAALPKLAVQQESGMLKLKWQTPDDLPFFLPVEVKIGDEIKRVEMKNGQASLATNQEKVEIDPNKWILMEDAE